jgi:hypothetical protein
MSLIMYPRFFAVSDEIRSERMCETAGRPACRGQKKLPPNESDRHVKISEWIENSLDFQSVFL